jgi:hypothetical protein
VRSAETSPGHRLAGPGPRRRSADPSELGRARQSLQARLAATSPTLWPEEWHGSGHLLEQRRASGGALTPLWELQALGPPLGLLAPPSGHSGAGGMFTIRETRAWSLSQSSLASSLCQVPGRAMARTNPPAS